MAGRVVKVIVSGQLNRCKCLTYVCVCVWCVSFPLNLLYCFQNVFFCSCLSDLPNTSPFLLFFSSSCFHTLLFPSFSSLFSFTDYSTCHPVSFPLPLFHSLHSFQFPRSSALHPLCALQRYYILDLPSIPPLFLLSLCWCFACFLRQRGRMTLRVMRETKRAR